MEDYIEKETINLIKIIISAIGAWIGYFIERLDGLIIALLFICNWLLNRINGCYSRWKLSSRLDLGDI